ncbi:MAG: N(4)-(beta-N-acetylglucosaminyl)-L-asparaginase [Anaerolineae bacterium]
MMLVVTSHNGRPGIEKAMQVLREGGTALDAIEAGIRLVELNEEDEGVGIGGLPNVLGQVELDASIMDGRTLAAGAVGAVRGYPHPISIARRVMELTPHVILVGEGANRFAAEMGFARCNLPIARAQEKWQERLREFIPDTEIAALPTRKDLLPLVKELIHMRLRQGTVNFLARDRYGNIACGVSTSGWPWKYPGRLGDSPIIGAGNYADNRYGAAACTHHGESAIRASTARSVVLYMKMGMCIEEACREAMRDLQPILASSRGTISIVAMDRDGNPFGITSKSTGEHYLVMWEDSRIPEVRDSALYQESKE